MPKVIKGRLLSMMLCFIMLILVLPTFVFAQTGVSREAEEHILNELRRTNIPNAAVAVIQGEETSFILKNSELDTLFSIASVTKPFTAFGVLLLEDMGSLSIYDPVNHHLPWFEVRYNGVLVPHDDITIHNLITHTSGIAQNEERFPRAAPSETTDEFIARLTGMEIDFYPATNIAYSNMAYIILGLLIEAVSGQGYDDFMTQQIFRPLGLYDTFTNYEQASDTGRVVSGYRRGFLHVWQAYKNLNRNRIINTAAGGLYSSASDLARWAGIQLGIIDVPEQFARIVQRSHILNPDANVPFAEGFVFANGGWYVNSENGRIEHAGGDRGYSAIIRLLPENNAAVVVLSNLRLENNVGELGDIALGAVLDNTFNSRNFDLLEWIDIGFTLLCAMGVVFLGLLIRLMIKLRKRLQDGEIIKMNFSAKNIRLLISGSIFSVAGLIFYYIFPFVVLDTVRERFLLNSPVSFGVAAIAIWIMVLYDVFSWWVKVSVQPAITRN